MTITKKKETKNQNRFSEWNDVNICTSCQHYWDSSCDGSKSCDGTNENTPEKPSDAQKSCFSPNRMYLYSEELKKLKKAFTWLSWEMLIFVLIFAAHIIIGHF